MGKHRTPQDRMVALQAQMVALTAKANKASISDNPKVKSVDLQIAKLNSSALKYKRWHKDATDNAARHALRSEGWLSRKGEAAAWLKNYNAEVAELKAERQALAAEIVKGM